MELLTIVVTLSQLGNKINTSKDKDELERYIDNKLEQHRFDINNDVDQKLSQWEKKNDNNKG